MYKTIVYFDDLSEEAKEKAREWYREGNDYPFLRDGLTEFIREEIEELGYSVSDFKVFWSLSYCQGDGVSFEGTLEKDGSRYLVKNSGRYYNEYAMDVECESLEDFAPVDCSKDLELFREVARKAAKWGYDYIETENDDEHVDEAIRDNEYTFSLDGERMTPDKVS